jgi:hypothetical protein
MTCPGFWKAMLDIILPPEDGWKADTGEDGIDWVLYRYVWKRAERGIPTESDAQCHFQFAKRTRMPI